VAGVELSAIVGNAAELLAAFMRASVGRMMLHAVPSNAQKMALLKN
jgi:hypothetical protein